MAAPIFKFRNIRVPITSNTEELVYAVDIGRGTRGLELGVLPEEVSSVVLTVQCSNKRTYIPNKVITNSTTGTNVLTTADTGNLTVDMPVFFTGTNLLGGLSTSTTYYVQNIASSTTFTVSTSPGGSAEALTTEAGNMTADFSSVKITARVKDLTTLTSVDLVKDYPVLANNAFDPLNGNLVLTAKLGLYILCNVPNVVDVTVSLLEIANATAT